MSDLSWLDELGPLVDRRDWQRPAPTVMPGRYCRLEPLDLARQGQDLWDQMFVDDPEHRQWMYLAGHGPFAAKEDFTEAWSRFDKAVDNLTYAVIPTDPALDLPAVPTGQFSFLRIRPEAGSIEPASECHGDEILLGRCPSHRRQHQHVPLKLGHRNHQYRRD